jgi:hypothetical protein
LLLVRGIVAALGGIVATASATDGATDSRLRVMLLLSLLLMLLLYTSRGCNVTGEDRSVPLVGARPRGCGVLRCGGGDDCCCGISGADDRPVGVVVRVTMGDVSCPVGACSFPALVAAAASTFVVAVVATAVVRGVVHGVNLDYGCARIVAKGCCRCYYGSTKRMVPASTAVPVKPQLR